MSSKFAWVALLCGGALGAAVLPRIEFPADSPVVFLSADYAGSSESTRGGATVLDLRAALSLRNASGRRIRGVTLSVLAQEVTAGGKASVTVPSLNVAPGESFPVHIDLRLLRPVQAGGGATVQVGLDGVLFEDLSFYGPNRLNSRRALTVYEAEARRDRQYFKGLLNEGGPQRLQQEVLASLGRQAERPGMDVQMVRGGRPTNVEPERQMQFAFLEFPDSPVEPMDGWARIAGNEASAPRLDVQNRSGRAVRSLEIGWIVRDQRGREFWAGAVPAELAMSPGERRQIVKDTTLKLPQDLAHPLTIEGITGFVSNVEFADGRVWIPARASLADPRLQRVLAPSPEEDRLMQLYHRRGLNALVEELKKF